MRHLGRPWGGWVLISSPLLLSLMAGCDSQSPAFVEHSSGIAKEDIDLEGSYSGDANAAEPSNDPTSEVGTVYDPARDDETPADKGETGGGPSMAIAKWTFNASRIEQGSLHLDAGFGQIEQPLQMSSNQVAHQLSFTQTNRPVATETFAQGSEQEDRSETFQQGAAAAGLLDILLVVDNSGSMAEEQVNLSSKLQPLLSYVQNSDWKIGVVTTDPRDGCLRGLISKGDSQANQAFASAVNAGTQGSGNERGILQAVNGLKGQCNANGSWLRTNSTLAVLVVTDEDNCSNGTGCGNEAWSRSDYLLDYMASIRQVGVNARVYGLGWHPSKPQSACRTAYYKAHTYSDAVSRSGGTWGSICDSDYSGTLSAISLDLSTILKTQFALQQTPYSGSLKVYVNNQLKTSGYQLRGNVVEFAEAPAAGAQIRASYKITTVEPKREFVLSSPADGRTLQVYLDGVATQAFSYRSAANSIEFTNAPVVNEIKAVYRKDVGLETAFALSGQVLAPSLQVKVAGNSLPSTAYRYDAGSARLILNQAPMDGLNIEVRYLEEVAPQLRYAVNVPASLRSRITIVDAETQRAMNFQIDGRDVVFPLHEYRSDRHFLVSYPVGEDSWLVDLGYPVLIESVKVVGSRSGSCRAVQVRGTEVDLSGCTFAQDEGIAIAFDYAGDHTTSFDLGSLDLDLEQYVWKVLINGQESKGFSIVDQMIAFEELPYYAQVEVLLYKK